MKFCEINTTYSMAISVYILLIFIFKQSQNSVYTFLFNKFTNVSGTVVNKYELISHSSPK